MSLDLVVTCARGTERALRFELEQLGASGVKGTGRGAVEFVADWKIAARILVESRIAHKLLWRLLRVEAPDERALVTALLDFPFEAHGGRNDSFAIDAHLHSCPWTHSLFAAQRVKDCLVDRFRDRGLERPSVDTKRPRLRYVFHWEGTQASLSLDLAGASLSRRGYRDPDAAAPMRETLAAAILALGHADVQRPFLDPCCGSGTLAIEQAWRALKRAPGLGRQFACEFWPQQQTDLAEALREVRGSAREQQLSQLPAPIELSDYHSGAVQSAELQVHAAGLDRFLSPRRLDARKLVSPGERPVVVSNLPFGERISGGNRLQLDGFYRTFGDRLRELPTGRAILFSGYPEAEALLDLGQPRRFSLMSGALSAKLLRYDW
ncbi:MAG: class I SAM-dependent RNA methyltransferase [Polyangiaceae bacterium]